MCTGGRDKVLNFYDTRRWKLYKTVPAYESIETVVTGQYVEKQARILKPFQAIPQMIRC